MADPPKEVVDEFNASLDLMEEDLTKGLEEQAAKMKHGSDDPKKEK